MTKTNCLLIGALSAAFVCLSSASPALAATIYIKSDGSGDANTIQQGINMAVNGDTVLLAAGTFTGNNNRNLNPGGKAIVIISESGPYVTIIDVQVSGRGFLVNSGETASTVISGLTIKNARAANGAAIRCNGASPTIENNIIVENESNDVGGGIYVGNASPVIRNNTIVANIAPTQGGGIYVTGAASTPLVGNNIIAWSTDGEGIACAGGAVPALSCNDIFGNFDGDAVCGTDLGGNVSANPEFCGSLASGNFYLQSDSPCSPAFSPCGQLVGALGVLCGSVATEQRTWGAIKSKYE